MAKSIDPQVVNPIFSSIVEDLVSRGGLPPTKSFEIAARPIEEYEDRMRINATEKFDIAVYIGVVNFYLNKADMQAHKARGAFVFYMDTEVADKIFKSAGLQVPYDEDDESMMGLCGNICETISTSFKERLADKGFPTLETSSPAVYKNTISEGVEFSKDQEETQEISFYYLKHKALVLEWTLTPLPQK